MTDNETNLTLLNVNQIVSLLSRAYIKLIKNGTPLKSFPSVMLWGPPGIGKSQGVREIAGNIQAKTGKKVSITDVRLLLFNPVDLRGIPTANADKTLSVWLKPQIFQMDESEDVINILFLDEITAAPQSVQAAAYQITLDRVIGEHKLPENCIVIAAGNRVTDKSVAYDTICEDIRRYRAESAGDILYGDESWWSSLDGSEVDALYRSALQQGLAYHQEQSRGFLPAGLVEEIYALSRPPIRWDIELAKWFDEQPLSTFLIFPMIVVGQLLGGSHPFYASPQRHPFLIWCEGPIITCILQKKRFLAQGVDWEKRNMPFRLITASILLFSAKRESMSPTK